MPNSSTSILPEDFSFCQHQHPVDFKLTETSEITRNYNNLVERALGLPNKELTKAKNRTQLVVDEEKATLIATLTRLIGDYSRGIKEVWRIMYGTSAEVHIPHRTHVNIDNVMMLLRMGGIDEESAGSEIQKITGVNARGFSKLHNEKLLKKQKREQIINE